MSGRSRSEHEFRLSGCAAPLAAEDVPPGGETIAQQVTVTLLTPPTTLASVLLDAPRGAILPRQLFAVRYLTRDGARRALFQSTESTALAGMRDRVQARMLTDPAPAPERGAYREPIGIRLSGRIAHAARLEAGTRVSVEIVDASVSGLCVATSSSLVRGDAVDVNAPPNEVIEAAAVEVVRRDPTMPTRFGARFAEPDDGKQMFEVLVAAAREARASARQRAAQIEPAGASAEDVLERLRSTGMYTRRDSDGRKRES